MDSNKDEQMDDPQQRQANGPQEYFQPAQPEDSDYGEEEDDEDFDEMGEDDSHGEYGPLDETLMEEEKLFPPLEHHTELVAYSQAEFEHPGQEIGTGQTGTVYKMLHKPTAQYFAVKKIAFRNQEDKELLLGELRTVANLNHEYHECHIRCFGTYEAQGHLFVVNIINSFELGVLFVVFEYVDSGNLSQFYNNKYAIKEQILGSVAARILKGLHYLHHREEPMIYRDLKPSNILIDSNGAIKLADFDLGGNLIFRVNERPDFSPLYMSPERLDGDASDAPSCDIWSLGMCILESAIGNYPYGSQKSPQDRQALIGKIINDNSPEAPKTLSTNFRDFVAKCLNKKAGQRPTARKLLKHPFVLASEDFPHDKAFKFLNFHKQMSRSLASQK